MQIKPLWKQRDAEEANAREVATRPGKTGDETSRDRIVVAYEDDWDGRCRAFGCHCHSGAAAGRDYVNLTADEISDHCRQPIIVALREAVFECHVLPLDVANCAQSRSERG